MHDLLQIRDYAKNNGCRAMLDKYDMYSVKVKKETTSL